MSGSNFGFEYLPHVGRIEVGPKLDLFAPLLQRRKVIGV
jgi:hypothetical protein